MKKSAPIKQKKALKRTPLPRRKTPLKRSPLKQARLKATPSLKEPVARETKPKATLKKSPTRIKRNSSTSKKGRAARGRAEFVKGMIDKAGGLCQISQVIWTVDREAASKCWTAATEVHEPLTRARGGATDSEDNGFPTCRVCHQWCHMNPTLAESVGLLLPSTF